MIHTCFVKVYLTLLKSYISCTNSDDESTLSFRTSTTYSYSIYRRNHHLIRTTHFVNSPQSLNHEMKYDEDIIIYTNASDNGTIIKIIIIIILIIITIIIIITTTTTMIIITIIITLIIMLCFNGESYKFIIFRNT